MRSVASRRGAVKQKLFVVLAVLLSIAASVLQASGPQQVLAQAVNTNIQPASSDGPLSITKTASSNSVVSGASLTWTIVVSNTGGAALSGVQLTDQVNGMTSLVLTASPGTCTQSASNVTCSMPAGKSLAGGATWTVTIQGTVTAAAGTTLNNTATATGTKSSTTFTASATASVPVTASSGGSLPDLTVSINAPTSVITNGALTR
jgi:uncharacterized repeat protein (TIGR01451 family)